MKTPECTSLFVFSKVLSAVAHLRYLHGKLHELARLPAGAAAVAVHIQLVAATVLLRLLTLRRPADVPVRGAAATHGPLARVWQQDHKLVEAAVKASEQQGGAVVCWTKSNRQLLGVRRSPPVHTKSVCGVFVAGQQIAANKASVHVHAALKRICSGLIFFHFLHVNHSQ